MPFRSSADCSSATVHGDALDRVERGGELADLVLRRDLDRRDVAELAGLHLAALGQRVDEVRESFLGDLLRGRVVSTRSERLTDRIVIQVSTSTSSTRALTPSPYHSTPFSASDSSADAFESVTFCTAATPRPR